MHATRLYRGAVGPKASVFHECTAHEQWFSTFALVSLVFGEISNHPRWVLATELNPLRGGKLRRSIQLMTFLLLSIIGTTLVWCTGFASGKRKHGRTLDRLKT